MTVDEFWWANVHDFDRLAAATAAQLAGFGGSDIVIGVIDAVGDPHFVTAGNVAPDAIGTALEDLLRAQSIDGTSIVPDGDGSWVIAALALDGRAVGGAAWRVADHASAVPSLDALRAHLALAVDVVAARYGRRRLRIGLAAVRRVSGSLSGALTDADIAASATSEAITALRAAACGVYRLHGDALHLVDPTTGDRALPDTVPLDGESPIGDCVRNGETIIRAMREGGDMSQRTISPGGTAAASSAWLALPLLVDDRPTGALALAFDRPRTFTPDELTLAATIADQSAQALARTRLQSELEHTRVAQSEQRFRAALDAMVDLVTIEQAIRDEHGRIVDFRIEYMNRTQIDVAGRLNQDLTGKTVLEAYPGMRDSELFYGYVDVVESGEPLVVDELPYFDIIDGNKVSGYYSVHIAKFGDGIIVSARDISDARRSRQDLEEAYEQLHAARQVAGLGIWSIDLATAEVTFSEEVYDMFGFDPLEPLPSLEAAIDMFIDSDNVDLVRDLVASTPETREPFMVELVGRRADGQHRIIMVAGTVSVDERDQPVRLWGTAQDVTEQRLAEQSLQATTEQLEQEHASLLLLQDAMSPSVPELDEVELYGVYEPAGEQARVGGDWFDAIVLDDGSVALIVGDVAGHGLPAATLMAQLRHALRAYLVQHMPPAEALEALNRLARRSPGQFHATCLAAIYDPATHQFVGGSAGHLPYVVVRDGVARLEEVNVGVPIGVREVPRYGGWITTLEPGDTVLLYTDGLIERRGETIDDGFARLLDIAARVARPGTPLDEMCHEIVRSVLAPGPALDDRCLLALRLP